MISKSKVSQLETKTDCLKFIKTFVDKNLLGEFMLKRSLALFLLVFSLSPLSFGDEAPAAEAAVKGSLPVDPAIISEVSMVIQQDQICARYLSPSKTSTLTAPLNVYKTGKASCVTDQERADFICRDSTSPELASTIAKVNGALTLIGSVAVKDACSNFAKVMDVAKAGLSAYSAACGAMKANCSSSCVKTEAALIKMQKVLSSEVGTAILRTPCEPNNIECMSCGNYASTQRPGYINAAIKSISMDLNKAEVKSISGKVTLCVGKYAELLGSAGLGIASLVASAKQGQSCDAATDGTGAVGPDLANLDVKCAIDTYKNTSECICHLNPRQTGCANSLEKTGNTDKTAMSASRGSNMGSTGAGGVSLPSGGLDSGSPEFANKSGSSAGGAGAPVGGGSGIGGGGSGGGGSGSAGNGDEGHKGLNTNILSGSGGGGGGGFGGGFGGSGSDSKYRPYLPGGAKDPHRGVAGQSVGNEVTGQAGKSNWEKVRERYRDNNSTLLGN